MAWQGMGAPGSTASMSLDQGRTRLRWRRMASAVILAAFAAACGYGDPETRYPDYDQETGSRDGYTSPTEQYGSLFGDSGADPLGGDSNGTGAGPGIDVNSYLWRASLDTISFMPLASADPFGGVIITDWYSPPEAQQERFKINIYIFGRELRADGVRAAVFRQNQSLDGNWADAEVEQQTVVELENAILARARQLRIASLQ